MANLLKAKLLSYMASEKFMPKDHLSENQLMNLIGAKVIDGAANTNIAFNPNDKTAVRKK
jgi:hypothetical protein